MQQVLLSALVVIELREDPEWVGVAQMSQTLPSVVLLLLGGSLADRLEQRTHLTACHLAAALTSLSMALLIHRGGLSLPFVILFAGIWGSLVALQLPPRESLLFAVGKGQLSEAVTGSTLGQFIFQAAGNRVSGLAGALGTAPLLAGQGLLVLLGVIANRALPRSEAIVETGPRASTFRDMSTGLLVVARSDRLRTLTLLVAANGLCFLGPFFVLCPLLVRDFYGLGIDALSQMMMMFPLGTIVGSGLLLWKGPPRRKGRVMLLGLLGGALSLACIGSGPPFPVLLLLVFAWGLSGGFFLNMGRTLFQQAAPDSQRARVLSVYALGLFGMSPLSSLACGFLAEHIGARAGCTVAGAAMALAISTTALFTQVRHFE